MNTLPRSLLSFPAGATMTPDRPAPDAAPAKVEHEPAKARRGRLKIFFGAASGVGKTYAMLAAAQERRAEGVDLVVGFVETHDRKEAAALLEGLELVPTRAFLHRGARLGEFDLDGALKRRPALILVDDLAHINAAGSRHPRRWQDVEELLEAGINVYTTLNVQHLESLADDVGEFAGIRGSETVPDTVFERADEVELVDLSPDELLARLKEGKVHLPKQTGHALANFFRKGNLIALRELSLRQTASRVDAEMQDYREDHAIRDVWQVSERVLVCIGPSPLAERLVRAGKRLAQGLRAEWIVVYVETPSLQRLPAARRDAVFRMLRLAEQLGAETVTLSASNMSEAIIAFARERNVSKIVMGKPTHRGWRRWILGSVVDRIIADAHNINVHLLGSPRGGESTAAGEEEPSLFRRAPPPGIGNRRRAYVGYAHGIAITAVCSLIAYGMSGHFALVNLIMVYLLGVIITATRHGQGPSVLASILGVAVFDVLFVKPYYSLSVSHSQYLVTLAGMLVVAVVTSRLTTHVRYQAKVAAHRERRATVLYAIGKELSACRSEKEILRIAARHVHAEFASPNVILFPDENGRISFPKDPALSESPHDTDLSVAQWVYEHNEQAGRGTHTLADAKAVYLPLAGGGDPAIGVLALLPADLRQVFLPEQRKLLDAFVDQIVQALKRVRLAEQARAAAVAMEAERLRNSLLSSISHDLRTPLASIVGSSGTLIERHESLGPRTLQDLGHTIHEEALRMSNLIDSILEMAKLETGAAQLNRQWHALGEIIGTAVGRLETRLKGREVKVKLPHEMLPVYLDAAMIGQVLGNLLENAVKYTPPESPIEISAESSAFTITLSVADRGPGIPKGEEEQLFEKFYRAHREGAQGGVGLGLTLCRAIVEAHGGWIRAKNRGTGGAVFTFTLPLEQAPPAAKPDAPPPETV